MNRTLKISIFLVGLSTIGYFGYKGWNKAKEAYKKSEEERKAKEYEQKEKEEKFNQQKMKFKSIATDEKIWDKTLNNEKITNEEDASYLYDKLVNYRNRALACSYYENAGYVAYVDFYSNLYNFLGSKKTTEASIKARIISFKKEDAEMNEIAERNQKAAAETLAHKRAMEKIEAEKDAQLDIYKAKLAGEEAKLKTIMETMSGDNKNVNHTLNIKTNVSED